MRAYTLPLAMSHGLLGGTPPARRPPQFVALVGARQGQPRNPAKERRAALPWNPSARVCILAIYHLAAKVIGRSSGRSAPGAAAYRAAEMIRDTRTGEVFDYTRKGGVEHREILAPDNAPEWMKDREQLWNAVEAAEKRKDAQLAREVEVALPRELSREQRLELVREFAQKEFVERGMIADIAVHNPRHPDGQERPHAHIMLTLRELTGDGFGAKNREWNGKDQLEDWREKWAEHANRSLERYGHEHRIDHRSYADQGIDREAQPKLGAAAAMERRGEITERGNELRQVAARNAERAGLARQLEVVRETLAEWKERAAEALQRGAETAREAYDLAKDRVGAWLGRAGDQAAPAVPAQVDRDAMLGRGAAAPEKIADAVIDREALLGRVGRDVAPTAVDRDAMLGRSSGAESGHGDTDRDESGRDR